MIISFIPSNFLLISISVISPYTLAFSHKPSEFNFSDLYFLHCSTKLAYISCS